MSRRHARLLRVLLLVALLAGSAGLLLATSAAAGGGATGIAANAAVDAGAADLQGTGLGPATTAPQTPALAATGDEENVTVEAADTPAGEQYATTVDGELHLEFDRLNEGARTAAGRVFAINSTTAETYLYVTVRSNHSDVSYFWGDDQGASATDRVRLPPGDSVQVGVAVDGRDDLTADEETFTVVVKEAPEPMDADDEDDDDRDGLSIDTDEPLDLAYSPGGAPASFGVSVTNRRWSAQREDLELTVGGVLVERREVVVPARESLYVTFEFTVTRVGTHRIELNGRHLGNVTVTGGVIQFGNATVEPAVVERGEPVLASVQVENHGDEPATVEVPLQVDDAVVDTTAVRLEPGEEETAEFEWRFDRDGAYDVTVGGQAAGTVRVEPAAVATAYRLSRSPNGLLGVLSVVALGGTAVVVRRWHRL